MAQFGYTLFCEGNSPVSLINQAVMAEQAGFDFLVISDHYHPWLTNQSHAGFAWSILGAVAQATTTIKLATMVTCPIIRYHPAIVAQMAATTAVISDNRFTLGLGSGEQLNEHVTGAPWPSVTVRHAMLEEAITVIKRLWEGDYLSHKGTYYTVADARVFDLPSEPIDMFVAASGPRSARLAAGAGAGLCVTEPLGDVVSTYLDAGGNRQRTWGQVVLAWAPGETQGLEEAHANFRFSSPGWKVMSELPNPVNFDAATKGVKPADLADAVSAGPDVDRHREAIAQYLNAGVANLAVAYPGQNFEEFFEFWSNQLKPALT